MVKKKCQKEKTIEKLSSVYNFFIFLFGISILIIEVAISGIIFYCNLSLLFSEHIIVENTFYSIYLTFILVTITVLNLVFLKKILNETADWVDDELFIE